MRLSTTTGCYLYHFSLEETVNILADSGFDAIDFCFFFGRIYCDESTDSIEFKNNFIDLRKRVEDKGMIFNQAHAPFPSSVECPKSSEEIFGTIVRSMRNASYLGIENIVVHPCHHLTYSEKNNPEKLFEMNMKFYNQLKPYCEEYNIHVAIENMYQQNKRKIVHSACSTPKEFIRYLDELNSEWFVGCLDIGHAILVCQDIADFIKQLGRKRLKCVHIHDVDGIEDSHTLPYYGIGNWEQIAKAFKEINYDGDFTFEAGNFIKNLPRELAVSASKHMCATGRYIMDKIKN